MEYYLVKEDYIVNKYSNELHELVLYEITKGSMEPIRQLDRDVMNDNLIKRNKYLDLYHDKPLIHDDTSQKTRYYVEIPETVPSKGYQNYHRMNWNDFHELVVIEKWMDSLEYNYPSICTIMEIGTTLEGRILKVLKVSNSVRKNTAVWIDAGIHAREWIAPAVNTFIADYVVRNFKTLPPYFTNKDWYFLPVVNPDGYEYTFKVDRMWRKNRAWYGGEKYGVDLNRNFSFAWGGINSSDDPTSPFFRGRGPFSEPESAAMRDVLKNSGINFQVYITLHSYGQVITFPFGYRDEISPDYIRLLEGAMVMSKAIYAATGNIYKVGISKDVLYGASGTSTDWGYGTAKIPFAYLIELRSKKHKFNLPREEIQETCNEILNCITALMDFVDK